MPRRTGLFLLPKFSVFVPVRNGLCSDASYDELLPDYRQNMQIGETGSVYAFQFKSKRTVCIPLRQNEINEGSRSLLPVCKSAAIFRHKAIGITVGLNFVKILQFFFVLCESSVIIGTFQGEDVE